MTETNPPYRYLDGDSFCLSARLLPDLNTGGVTDTLSITIEGSDEPQSVHVPAADVPAVAAGIAAAAGQQPAATVPASAPTDRSATRERIVAIIERLYNEGAVYALEPGQAGLMADALVGELLPAPVDRAAILREAADAIVAQQEREEATEHAQQGDLDHETEIGRGYVYAAAALLRRLADAASGPGRADGEAQQDEPQGEPWRGATELAPDRVIAERAARGLVGYRQDKGRLLHCIAHKPAPVSRCTDFHEVEAADLPDGGICVHPRCGRDLLAAWPAAVSQPGKDETP